MRRVLPAFLLLLPLCASLRLGGEVFCHYDDQGRRQFEDRYDYYDYDTDGGHTGYGTIGGNYSGTYYSYNEPVTVKLHDGVSPVRAYTLTASSTGNTGNLSVPAEDWLRGSDWGGGIGGILYSQVEFGNATTASYYHYDGRGDVVALTSNTGNVTYAAAYNAYGTHAVSLNATTNVTITGTQEVGTDLDPFRTNTREEWDSADGTAFVKEGHRIRGLETDTYLTRDPLGQAAGTNYYTYVLQDEWTKTDPLGEETESGYDYQDKIAQLKADRDNARIAQSEKDGEYGKPDSPEAKAKAAALTKDENDARDKTMADDAKGKANLQATAKWARDHNIAVDESTLDDDTGHSSSVGPSISNILGVDSPRDPPTAGQAQYASIRGQMTAADLVEVGKQAAMMMVPGGGEEEIIADGAGEALDAARDAEAAAKEAAQMKKLSTGEIKKLQDAGHDVHDLKPGAGTDLFKDKAGNIYVKPKSGAGPGDPTGININEP